MLAVTTAHHQIRCFKVSAISVARHDLGSLVVTNLASQSAAYLFER